MALTDLRCRRTEGRRSCDAPRGSAPARAHSCRLANPRRCRSESLYAASSPGQATASVKPTRLGYSKARFERGMPANGSAATHRVSSTRYQDRAHQDASPPTLDVRQTAGCPRSVPSQRQRCRLVRVCTAIIASASAGQSRPMSRGAGEQSRKPRRSASGWTAR